MKKAAVLSILIAAVLFGVGMTAEAPPDEVLGGNDKNTVEKVAEKAAEKAAAKAAEKAAEKVVEKAVKQAVETARSGRSTRRPMTPQCSG